MDRFDLAELARTTAEQMSLLAEDKGISIVSATRNSRVVKGDRVRLKQVVVNLLDNAIKYTPAKGAIQLRVAPSTATPCWKWKTTASAFPPDALPHVFERFYRVDKARSRDPGARAWACPSSNPSAPRTARKWKCKAQSAAAAVFASNCPGKKKKFHPTMKFKIGNPPRSSSVNPGAVVVGLAGDRGGSPVAACASSRGGKLGKPRSANRCAADGGRGKSHREDLFKQVTIPAEFRPYVEVELHAKVSGYVEQMNVDFGDKVKAGQLLATLEVPELQAELNNAHRRGTKSRGRLHQRALDLPGWSAVNQEHPNLVAQQDLDTAEANDLARRRHRRRQSRRGKYQTLVSYTQITAPFDGVVTWRYADPGALIQAGTASGHAIHAAGARFGQLPAAAGFSRVGGLRPRTSFGRSGGSARGFAQRQNVHRQNHALHRQGG
jgi:biotin carboxyl carrier protein